MAVSADRLVLTWKSPSGLRWFTAVNHRSVGARYIFTAFAFFLLGGINALLLRYQLAQPENDFLDAETYNQIFTMHGSTMMFLFAVPIMEGFASYFVPLMIGARDLPFPRLNAFGYYTFLFGGLILYSSIIFGAMPDGGWFAYPPLTTTDFSPGLNLDFWLLGITMVELSAFGVAIEILVGIFKTRATGMSIDRWPLFVWNVAAITFAILIAFPALVAASILLELDRAGGTRFYDPGAGGDSLLWQHLFWIFGHPEVYIQFLPAAGIISMVIPTFSRRPIVGYLVVALAAVATAFLSFGLWVHHMFATGLPFLASSFFSAASFMVAIPAGLQVFAWIITIWLGRPVFTTAFLFAIGFLVIFVAGGITGVMLAVVPFNTQAHDTYFVVAHFHYVLVGGVVFPVFAALYFWLPKMTGRLLSEKLGQLNFWLIFIGFNVTFFPMHIVGLLGMPRRVYTYDEGLGWTGYNLVSSAGAVLLAAGVLVFLWNFISSRLTGPPAGNDPWGGNTLEWATSSPPQQYNFREIPDVRSRYPMWEQDSLAPPDDNRRWLAQTAGIRRETTVSTGIDAAPVAVVGLPTPTFIPFLLAAAIAVALIGVLSEIYVISILAVVVSAVIVGAWHWPSSEHELGLEPQESMRERSFFGLVPAGVATAWWGTVLYLVAMGAFLASLLFAYYFLWGRATEWPLDDISRPNLVLPIAGLVALFAAATSGILALRKSLDERGKASGLFTALAGLLGIVFLVLLAIDYARVDFTATTNAYGSLYFIVTGALALNVAASVLLSLWGLVHLTWPRSKAGLTSTADVAALYWAFNAVAALIVYGTVYLVPYLGTSGEQVRL